MMYQDSLESVPRYDLDPWIFVFRYCSILPIMGFSTKSILWRKNTYQVIQAVTCLSPNLGGHQQPLKGSRFHHPTDKGHKELPGDFVEMNFRKLDFLRLKKICRFTS